jgi:hypothetical protein
MCQVLVPWIDPKTKKKSKEPATIERLFPNAGTASVSWSDGGGRLRTEQKNIDNSHPAEAKKRHEEQQIKLHADGDGDDASPDEDKSDKADGSVRKSTRVRKKARV